MSKRVAVLGSTGSIGCQVLDVLGNFPDLFDIFAIAGNTRIDLLTDQIKRHHPSLIGIGTEKLFSGLHSEIKGNFYFGVQGLMEIARHPLVDIVIVAISGSNGLLPTWTAVEAGKKIGLASKEVMVMAGCQLLTLAKKTGAIILPIDSELGALWQCIRGEEHSSIKRVFLTCSGGPFRGYTPEQLFDVSPEDVMNHPNWSMGKKISVDSATLMNKGLEVIETHFLFNLGIDQISILLHPQSYVHSMVEFIDGNIKAHLGNRDMRLFIQSILFDPLRVKGPVEYLDWKTMPALTFETIDIAQFTALDLAYSSCKAGGTFPVVLCSANNEAVRLFLNGQIGFTKIVETVAQVVDKHDAISNPTIQDILMVDQWATDATKKIIMG